MVQSLRINQSSNIFTLQWVQSSRNQQLKHVSWSQIVGLTGAQWIKSLSESIEQNAVVSDFVSSHAMLSICHLLAPQPWIGCTSLRFRNSVNCTFNWVSLLSHSSPLMSFVEFSLSKCKVFALISGGSIAFCNSLFQVIVIAESRVSAFLCVWSAMISNCCRSHRSGCAKCHFGFDCHHTCLVALKCVRLSAFLS